MEFFIAERFLILSAPIMMLMIYQKEYLRAVDLFALNYRKN